MPVEEIRDHLGNERRLGWKAPDASYARKMRASRTSIQTLREENGLPPLIPRGEWKPVEFVTGFSTDLINDQRSSSGCTGWSAAGGMMRQRAIRGQEFVRLSGAAIYAQINGGRDDGSNIIDALKAIESKGTCLESEMNFPKIYANQIPAGSLRYREDVAITLATSEECATAIQMGILPQVPVMAWSGWERWSGDGVAATYSRKGYGNHSVYLAGLEFVSGRWYFRMVNSWTKSWGPFRDGTCRLDMAAIDNCAYADDSYGHGSTLNPKPGEAPEPVQ